MKYYSEKLNKLFNSEETLFEEERLYEEQLAEEEKKEKELKVRRKSRAEEVLQKAEAYTTYIQESDKKAQELWNDYVECRNNFINDYGSFNVTYKTVTPLTVAPRSLFDVINDMFSF